MPNKCCLFIFNGGHTHSGHVSTPFLFLLFSAASFIGTVALLCLRSRCFPGDPGWGWTDGSSGVRTDRYVTSDELRLSVRGDMQ